MEGSSCCSCTSWGWFRGWRGYWLSGSSFCRSSFHCWSTQLVLIGHCDDPHGSYESKCFDISGSWHMSSAYRLSWSLGPVHHKCRWSADINRLPQITWQKLPADHTPADPDQIIPTGSARSGQAYQNFAETCRLPAWPNKYPKYELYSVNICSVAAKKKMRWRHLILSLGVLQQNLPHHQSEFAKSH